MKSNLYNCIMEKRDIARVEKLLTLTDPETFFDDVRRFTRKVETDHAIRRWQCLAEVRYDEILMERDGKIVFQGFPIYKTYNGYQIENGNGQALRVCDSIGECKHRIMWQEV